MPHQIVMPCLSSELYSIQLLVPSPSPWYLTHPDRPARTYSGAALFFSVPYNAVNSNPNKIQETAELPGIIWRVALLNDCKQINPLQGPSLTQLTPTSSPAEGALQRQCDPVARAWGKEPGDLRLTSDSPTNMWLDQGHRTSSLCASISFPHPLSCLFKYVQCLELWDSNFTWSPLASKYSQQQ